MSGPALADLRRVDRADVYKGDALAGRLLRVDSGVLFTYEPGYLSDPSSPAVARSLPRSAEPVRASAGAVPPFFAGLLPEGLRLQAVVTATRTSADDHLTLLLAVGLDTIGDVRIVLPGASPVTPPAALVEDEIRNADLLEVFARATSTSLGELERVALPGVQAKVSAAMLSTPVPASLGPAILKLNPPSGYPRLIENEHFFLRMAADSGLTAARAELVHDRNGRSGLLVARFDRVQDGAVVRRLAQEDAVQLLGEYPAAKYRLRTERVTAELAEAVADGDGSRPLAVRRILEQVALSYLIGNGDLHGKNFSVQQSAAGPWTVTPVYDLVTTQPHLADDPMALDLYGRANRLTRRHLLESFGRLGLQPRAALTALDRICEAAPRWIERLPEIGFEPRPTERLADLMRRRLRELRGEAGRDGP